MCRSAQLIFAHFCDLIDTFLPAQTHSTPPERGVQSDVRYKHVTPPE
jgi:hypothetical protein